MGVTENIMQFQISSRRENRQRDNRVIKIKFKEKFSANNFALSDAEDNTSGPLNRGGIADITFVENTISNSSEVMRAKFLGSNGLFCFNSTCKLGSFKNPFAAITSLSELYLRIRRFFPLVQTKKMISMNYIAAAQAAENHGDE